MSDKISITKYCENCYYYLENKQKCYGLSQAFDKTKIVEKCYVIDR